MAVSGISMHEECKACYTELKLKKKFQFLIFKLDVDPDATGAKKDDLTRIVIDVKGEPGSTFDDFTDALKGPAPIGDEKPQCRYGIVDYKFNVDGAEKDKILFFTWVPEGSKVKDKMLYAASKEALTKGVGEGISKIFHASDADDLSEDTLLETVKKMVK